MSNIIINPYKFVSAIPFPNTYSLDFDGVDDYVDITGGNVGNVGQFTLSFWVKGVSQANGSYMFSATPYNVWTYFYTLGTSFVWHNVNGNIKTLATGVFDGNWHHIVVIFNPTGADETIRTYKDNILASNNVTDWRYGQTVGLYNGELKYIGGVNGASGLEGNLDEVAVWHRELSEAEIAEVYNFAKPGDLDNLAPVAWWRMGDSGLFFNGEWEIPEQTKIDNWSSHSFDFDGVNDYVDCGDIDALDNVSTFTISVWFKLDGTGNNDTIFAKTTDFNNRIDIIKHSNGILYFQVYNGGNGYLGVNFSDLGWNHVAMVFDGSQGGTIPAAPYYQAGLQCYLNGSKITTFNDGHGTIPAITPTLSNNFLIGEWDVSAGYFLEGKVDELSIWSTALTDANISTLWNNGTPNNLNTALGTTPVNWWRMGESSNWNGTNWQLPDYSKNSLFSQKSFNFDGVDAFIDIGLSKPPELNLTGDMSISAWINTNNISSIKAIVSDCNSGANLLQFNLDINRTPAKISVLANTTTIITSSLSLSVSTWYHIVMTRAGSAGDWDYVLYINGLESNGGTANTAINPAAQQGSAIGRYGNFTNLTYVFDGSIDDVSIWDKELSVGEVTAIWNNGKPTDLSAESGLVGYWTFDDATFSTNWTVPDNSSNSNDGTSSGMVETDLEFNTPTNPNSGLSSGMDEVDLEFNTPDNIIAGLSNAMPKSAKVNNAPDNINQGLTSGMVEGDRVEDTP